MSKRKGDFYCIKIKCINYAKNFGKEKWDSGKECKIGKCPKYAKCPGAVSM